MAKKNKNKNIKAADKMIKTDYPFLGPISTYLNTDSEIGEMSNVEAEIKAMKSKEKIKDRRDKGKT